MRVIRFTCVFVAFTISALASELEPKKTPLENPTAAPPAEQHDEAPNVTDAVLPGIINPTSLEPLSVLSRNASKDSLHVSTTVEPNGAVISASSNTSSSFDGPVVTPDITTVTPNTTTIAPNATTIAPNTTTIAPNTTTIAPNTTTIAPNTTTIAPNTTTVAPKTTTVAPNTTTVAPNTTTVAPSTTTPGNVTTMSPNVTTAMPPTSTACPPIPSGRHFDGLSFIGGIIFAVCLLAVAAFFWKFSKTFHEENYRTL